MIDGIRWLGRKHRWGLELGLWAVGIGLVSSLPYVVGYLAIGPERRFMGFAFNVSDHVQYFAWWRAFQQGFPAPNLLTPEPTPATYFNLLWWLLAQVSRIAGLGYEATYQVLRVLSILITVAVLGLLYRRVAPSVSQARAMLAMALLGSGFAWLHPVVKRLQGWLPFPSLMAPYVPSIAEPNTFFSAIAYPHFLIALTSITAILWLAYEGIECGRWRASLGAGLLALSLSLHHTYDLLTIGAVLGGWILWRMMTRRSVPWAEGAHAALVLGMAAPGALYMAWLTRQDPTWREVLAQFVNAGVFTPPPLQLLLLLGLPFLLALVGLGDPRRWRAWTPVEAWMGVWFLAHPPLAYLPLSFQIHLLNGWQVPIAYWAVRGVERIVQRRPALTFSRGMRWALILSLPANLYLLGWRILDLSRGQPPYSLHRDEVAALDWVAAHGCADGVVMAPEPVGAFVPHVDWLPGLSRSLDRDAAVFERREQVRTFYSPAMGEPARRALIERYGITRVIVGADGASLEGIPWLIPVFQRPRAAVFVVQMAREGASPGGAP